MNTAHNYNISIRFGDYEGEACFEARVRELPDIAEYADTFEEVYALAVDSIEVTMEVLAEKGKTMPDPQIVMDDYSGRVTLRLPKSLHRALAQASEEEGVSLNQYMTNVLTYYSGFAAGVRPESESSAWMRFTQETSQIKTKASRHLKLVDSSQLDQKVEWQRTG
jgi:predicted HicB family RNase H-like nuclease